LPSRIFLTATTLPVFGALFGEWSEKLRCV
jgi:hypothetical protein